MDIKKSQISGIKIKKASIFDARLGNKDNLALKQSTLSLQASRIPLADNALVPTWSDTFGRSSATQGTTAAQPTFDIDGLNGKSCVVFDGTGDFMETSMVADTEDATFIFAGSFSTQSTAESVIIGTGHSGTTRGTFGFANGYFAANAGDLAATTAKSTTRVGYDMVPFVGTIIRSGKTIKIRINGVEEYSGAYGGTTITGYPYRIGAYNYRNNAANLFFIGKGSCISFTKSALPITTIQNIEKVFAREIGIDFTPYEVFVVAGQSNTHRGNGLDQTLDFYPSNVYQYGRTANPTYPAISGKEGQIIPAVEPLDHWTPSATQAGFTNAFVKKYIEGETPTNPILIVPCGYQGTTFGTGEWGKGNTLYEDMVARVNAIRIQFPKATLKAVLWHQGEAATSPLDTGYQTKLDQQIADFRTDAKMASATTPWVLGEMVPDWVALDADRQTIQTIINDTPSRVANTAVASGAGLTAHTAGYYHYSMTDHRIFGERYYDAYASLS